MFFNLVENYLVFVFLSLSICFAGPPYRHLSFHLVTLRALWWAPRGMYIYNILYILCPIYYTYYVLYTNILYLQLWWDLVSPRGNAGNAVWDRCRSRYPPVFVASIVHTGILLFSQVRKYSWQRCPEDSWQEALLSPAPLIFRGQVRLKHLLSSNTFILWACLQHLLISTAYVLEAQGKGFDFCVSNWQRERKRELQQICSLCERDVWCWQGRKHCDRKILKRA